jgi:molecular chaperone DnaJ
MNPFEVLGLEKAASFDEIKKRFYQLAKQLHPDTANDEAELIEKQKKFAQITQAYNMLKKNSTFQYKDNTKHEGSYSENILNKAKKFMSVKDFNSAINILMSIKDYKMGEVEKMLGECYIKKERFHDALKHFKAAYDMNQWDMAVRFKMGFIYEKIGLKNSARKIYQEILSIDPSNKNALEHLSKLEKDGFSLSSFLKGKL